MTNQQERVFGLLPESDRSWGSAGASAIINITVGVLFILFASAVHHDIVTPSYHLTTLAFPVSEPPLIRVVPPLKTTFTPPPVTTQPKIAIPRIARIPELMPPVPSVMKQTQALPEIVAIARRTNVVPAAQPKVGTFVGVTPTSVANNASKPSVHMGGFGDANGVKVNPNATGGGQHIAALGSFGMAPGSGYGAGTAATKGSIHGTAFGSGAPSGGAATRQVGQVASSGFGVVAAARAPQAATASVGSVMKLPEVLREPKPIYTAEARAKRIQGEVTLQVLFDAASGKVIVLHVVHGLGYGLDDEAKRVAEQIEFRPASQNGQPVNHTTYIHIVFQLA